MNKGQLNFFKQKIPPKNILSKKITSYNRQKAYKISSVKFQMALSKNLFGFEQIDVSSTAGNTLIFEEIRKEVEEYLLEESDDADSADGIFDFLSTLPDTIQEEFDKLLDDNTNKKCFLRALTRIFALLLNMKAEILEKIKRTLKIAIETTIKIWQGQN